MTRRGWWASAMIAWLVVVGWVTLQSAPGQVAQVADLHWYCVVCGDAGVADVILNILLFMPLGVAARALGAPLGRTLVCVFLLSLGIETYQGLVLIGRDAALGDVLSNSSGGVLGWLVFPHLMSLALPEPRLARRGVVLTVALSMAIWFATGIGLRPSLSDAAPWVGQILHRWPGRDPFPGSVQRVSIDGIDVPNDPLAALPPWRDSISTSLEVTRTDERTPGRRISIVRIVDAEQHALLSIGETGEQLVFEIRLRASRWRLHTPEWVFEDSADIPSNQQWYLGFRWRPDGVDLISHADTPAGASRQLMRPLSIGLGWVFIHPFVSTVSRSATWWTILWLGWWFGLVGWLSGALGWRIAALAGVAEVLSLVVAAIVTDTPWHGGEVLGAMIVFGVFAALAERRVRPASGLSRAS